MADEWGPWIDHEGKGCPLPVGTVVNAAFRFCDGELLYSVFKLQNTEAAVWFSENLGKEWCDGTRCPIVERYRVKRPRALREMIARAEGLPVTPDREGAPV